MRFKNSYIYVLIFYLLSQVSSINANSNNFEIDVIRNKFAKAVENEKEAYVLLEKLNKLEAKGKTPLILAYKGAAEALIAKFSWNPYSKINYLRKSQRSLQLAINNAPENAEIRFLRFSIQHFVPAFLGLSNNIEEDKKIIIAN